MKNFIKPILGFQWLCLLCLCGTTATAFAQTEIWNHYLGNSPVKAIVVDAQGNKWFGTTGNGLFKFDGTNWVHYNASNSDLSNNNIRAIAIDAQGNKWIGADNLIFKFDGINWTKYTNMANYSNITAIRIDSQDNKWFVGGGIFKFDGVTWTTHGTQGLSFIYSMAIDSQGNKWFGGDYGRLFKFDNTTWTTYDSPAQATWTNNNYYISSIAIDLQGNKWINTWAGNSFKFDGTSWTTLNGSGYGTCLTIDNQGNKWFGTLGNGVYKFDNTSFVNYNVLNTNSSLKDNRISAIIIDAQGDKWIGTDNGGISKFDNTNWLYIRGTGNSGLAHNRVNTIISDRQNNKWIGTVLGLSKFDGNNWTTYNQYNTSALNSNQFICSIAEDSSGNIWCGTFYNLLKFDGNNWTRYNTGGSTIRHIAIDNLGNKWIANSFIGIMKFDGSTWTTYSTSNSGLVSNLSTCIVIDAQNNKWIGTNGGISKFDGTNWTTYNTINGQPFNSVNSIAIDMQGNLWAATTNGVAKFNGVTWTYDNVLGNIDAINIKIDTQNNKWITTRRGIYKSDGVNWITYNNTNSGLYNNDVTTVCIDKQQNKWFGTNDAGVSVLLRNPCVAQITSDVPNNQLTCVSPNATLTPSVVTGGVAPYTYRWENGSTVALRTVHRSGSYAVTITDANGCVSSSSIQITSEPTRVELSFLPDTIPILTCLNESIHIVIPDAILQRLNQFTYIIKRDGNVMAQGLAPAYPANRVFNVDAILGGVYDFEFTPLNTGCTVTGQMTMLDARNRLNVNDFRITAPTTTLTCTTTSIPLTVVGANGNPLTGYTYAWTNTDFIGQVSNSRTINTAGTYSVWVINTLTNCRSLLPQTIEIQQNIVPPTISITASNPNFTCGINSIALTATGAATYNWNDNTTANPKTIQNTGTFTVTGTGANGCQNTANITIGQTAGVVTLPPVQQTICQGSTLTIGNQSFTTAGDYTIRKTGRFSCDTTYVLRLSVEDSTFRQAISIAAGTSYTIGGSTYSVSGTYVNRVPSTNGCMRTVTTVLTVLPVGIPLDTAYRIPNVVMPCQATNFCVDITKNNISSDTRGWQDTLFYPSNCVRFQYGLRGTAIPSGFSDFWVDSVAGRIHWAVTPAVGVAVASTGTIAQVCFQLKNNTGCNAPYTITASKMLETFDDNARNRFVNIGSSRVTTTTNDTVNMNMYYVGNQPQAFGNVAGTGNAYTEITSCNPNVTGVRTPDAQGKVVCKAGDAIQMKRVPNANPLNRLNVVGASDAYKIVQFANHNPSVVPQDGMHWLAGDADGSGQILANDAYVALQISVGLRDPQYLWLPSTQVPAIGSTTVPLVSNCISMPSVNCAPQSMAVWGIQRGDFVGQSISNNGQLAPLRQDIWMDLTRTYRIGDTIVIPIGYESAAAVNAVDLDITTLNNRLRFAQVEAKPNSGFDQFLSNPTNNMVRNSGFGNNINGMCFLQLKVIVPNGVTLQASDFTATRSLLNGVDASFGFRTTTTTCVTANEEVYTGNVQLYPNPTAQQLTIDYSESVKQLSIVNLLGQPLKTLEINASGRMDVDVSALPSGVYFLKINEKAMKKFVKL